MAPVMVVSFVRKLLVLIALVEHGGYIFGVAASDASTNVCAVSDGHCIGIPVSTDSSGVKPHVDNVELVVTRFKEDIRWLDAFADIRTVIYDRGGVNELMPKPRDNLEVFRSDNVGREDESMLRHVLVNYDNLRALTVFLQGWPFAHCAGAIAAVHKAIALGSFDRAGHGVTPGLVPITHTFHRYTLSDGVLGFSDEMFKTSRGGDPSISNSVKESVDHFNETCMKLLGRYDYVGSPFAVKCPNNMWVAEGAQWAVSRERLRSQPRNFYRNALRLGNGVGDVHRGLVLEALWPIVWGAKDWTPVDTNSPRYHELENARMLHSGDTYCQLPYVPGISTGPLRSVGSCEEHMATCELTSAERSSFGADIRRQRPRQIGFELFSAQRPRFNIDVDDQSGALSMQARLIPVRFGSKPADADAAFLRYEFPKDELQQDQKTCKADGPGCGGRKDSELAHATYQEALDLYGLAMKERDAAREIFEQKRQELLKAEAHCEQRKAALEAARKTTVDLEAAMALQISWPTPVLDTGGLVDVAVGRQAPIPRNANGTRWTIRSHGRSKDNKSNVFVFQASLKRNDSNPRFLFCDGVEARLGEDMASWRVMPTGMGFVRLQDVSSGATLHMQGGREGKLTCLFNNDAFESTFLLRTLERDGDLDMRGEDNGYTALRSLTEDRGEEVSEGGARRE
eukprot:TRINITY_DN42991_c0_g1_i1.p1 TRINITY_DN42991_c0_g1~~TRINITY_DN42991_c0_g1_i1.p1  ORF type:complete len:709 (-),score=84.94 TRINITY_DN42991_c0_g1_i1:74-2122(-)